MVEIPEEQMNVLVPLLEKEYFVRWNENSEIEVLTEEWNKPLLSSDIKSPYKVHQIRPQPEDSDFSYKARFLADWDKLNEKE